MLKYIDHVSFKKPLDIGKGPFHNHYIRAPSRGRYIIGMELDRYQEMNSYEPI